MDLTPQVINEVEFSMARRGYDPDQVDEFLEKVAVAVGELNDRLAELRDRVVAAERRASDAERRAAEIPERVVAAPPTPTSSPAAAAAVSAAAEAELETLKRTLLLAQRTADAAVREAEEEAARLIANAEVEARSVHEATLQGVLDEITRLESIRDDLRRDADALDRHVEIQRGRLEGTIADLQRILVEPARLSSAPPAIEFPPDVPELEPVIEAEAVDDEVSDEPTLDDDVADDIPTEPAAEADEPEPQPEPRFVTAEDNDDDEAWARFDAADEEGPDEGPRTEPVLRLDRIERAPEGDDDAYLSELRKAMLDDTGAPDATDLGYFDEADAGRAARTRFGRRR